MRRGAFTIIELCVVVAIIVILLGIIVPSCLRAKELTRRVLCKANLRGCHGGLWNYATDHRMKLPPFGFSSVGQPDLSLSGHWGGTGGRNDPAGFGRPNQHFKQINLWALVADAYLSESSLHCTEEQLNPDAGESYFAHTEQFSSYCLRFPFSGDLVPQWAEQPDCSRRLRTLYSMFPGGMQNVSLWGQTFSAVPQVRIDRSYRLLGTGQRYDVAHGALLADAFWIRGQQESGGGSKLSVSREIYHGDYYNVLRGDGSAITVKDNGTIATQAVPEGQSPPASGKPYEIRSGKIWQYFDQGGVE